MLIVDEDGEAIRRYQRALAERGYAVATACDEQAAIRLASERRFDVIVGDIDMRGQRGGDLLIDIRNRRRDLPLVLLSNGVAFASARVAVACRADRYLLKPISGQELVEIVVETIHDSAASSTTTRRRAKRGWPPIA